MLVLLFLEAAAVPTAFTSSNTLRTAFADWCDASKRGSTEAAHGPISDWDVSGVNSLYELYSAVPQTHRHTCNPDISRWDVSNVINMRSAFQDAQSFNQDLSNWNVGKVTNLNRFMAGARAFNQDISGWNVANVEDMDYVFQSAWAFNQDISGWDVGKVTRMDGPFRDTPALDNCNKKAISIAFSTATGAWPGEHSGFATLDCFYPPPTAPPSLPPTLPPSSPPPPLTGLHLKEDAAKVHFGQNMECTLELKPGPPPYLESNCPINAPPPAPSPPSPAPPTTPPPEPPAAPPWSSAIKFDEGATSSATISAGSITNGAWGWATATAWHSHEITATSGEYGVRWECSYPQSGGHIFIGLVSGTTSALRASFPTTHPQLSYTWYIYENMMQIRDPGYDSVVHNQVNGQSWAGQTFELRIVTAGCPNGWAQCVQYVRDGSVVRTSTTPVTYPLHVGVQFGAGVVTISNIHFLSAADAAGW